MMKKNLLIFSILLIGVSGCSDRPEEIPNNSHINVYPNPAIDRVEISVNNPHNQPATLNVFDATGETLLKETVEPGNHTFPVLLGNKPSGSYYAVFEAGSEKFTKRFLKK